MISRIKNRWAQKVASLSSESLLARFLLESFPEHRKRYFLAIIAMVIVAGMTAATAWMMGEIVDSMTNPENRSRIMLVSGAVAAIFIVRGFASYAQMVLMARAGNRIVAQKQESMYRQLLEQDIAFFSGTESSDVLVRVTQSAQMARGVIDTIVTGFVRDLLTLVGLIGVMFWQQPVLSVVSLVVGPLALWGIRKILSRVRAVMMLEMAGLAEIFRVVQETSTGARIIKAFALERLMTDRMDEAVHAVEKRANKMVRLESATTPLMDSIAGLAIASIVFLSTVNLFGQSAGTPGQLMSFVTAFLMAYEPAKRLARMRITIEAGMVGVRMMYDLLDRPATMVESPTARDLPDGPGKLVLEHVGFSYANGQRVLDGLSLELPQGGTTALVGPSGSGKSTILNLLLRLYDPDDGRILLDGIDLREVRFASLRRKISYVGQDTFLFSTTIRENLRLVQPDASDDAIYEAARVANADEFIRALPQGYDTPVGENGVFLSGGQRQRLAIARAVMRHPQVLLLDEATSALDSLSETLVRDALNQVTQGVTTVVVAHRLSTVLRADMICYLEQGQVVESGRFDELLARGGKFAELYERQFAKS
ncbi:ABC transporter ATP-binding protein [Pseudotabrizicola formosa]|uniref:ABC transporter ATP-binding protein n=1 Tax=Pseudotabrizicola formosa TaxID=2030009 RepID=UPI000CD10DED|nr:ABC transporter ATP-binding protein [Pseudotabrizicola formosa]